MKSLSVMVLTGGSFDEEAAVFVRDLKILRSKSAFAESYVADADSMLDNWWGGVDKTNLAGFERVASTLELISRGRKKFDSGAKSKAAKVLNQYGMVRDSMVAAELEGDAALIADKYRELAG